MKENIRILFTSSRSFDLIKFTVQFLCLKTLKIVLHFMENVIATIDVFFIKIPVYSISFYTT